MIEYAIDAGITSFDTAKVYWEWWEKIFSQIEYKRSTIGVSTKIPSKKKPTQSDEDKKIDEFYDIVYIKEKIDDSLVNIWWPVNILYLHNRSKYRTKEMMNDIFSLLASYKNNWHIQHIGVSLPDNYSGELSVIIEDKRIEYIQINHNSFNNNTSLINTLHESGKKVNIRSIFGSWLLLWWKHVTWDDIRSKKYETVVYDNIFHSCCSVEESIHKAFATKYVSWVIIGMTMTEHVKNNLSLINNLWKN